ncbi:hypothetical protein FQN54_000383 [Arachnomyces sp. PD_36]|nr:hypothetical protein FQN54_000383 [Arachnomyces sp. PD_36]
MVAKTLLVALFTFNLVALGQDQNADAAGNGNGQQFITGKCLSDADCASGCCGFNSGLCAGAVVAQERDGGCGFGDAQSNDDAAQALQGGGAVDAGNATAAAPAAADQQDSGAGGENADAAGNGSGDQFITGACESDADCASGCCGFNSGLCAGAVVAQERDGGCGFGDAQPNDDAAVAFQAGNRKMRRGFRGISG